MDVLFRLVMQSVGPLDNTHPLGHQIGSSEFHDAPAASLVDRAASRWISSTHLKAKREGLMLNLGGDTVVTLQ